MKPGKYVGHRFTPDQKKARRLWERANKEQVEINDALKVITWNGTRERLHARLDRHLDAIERTRAKARELFAEVDESFTVASMTMRL